MKNIKLKMTAIVIGVITIVGLTGCAASKTADKPVPSKQYNYSQFTKIKVGMTYEETKKILGAGKKDSDKQGKISYKWKNDDYSFIDVTYSTSTNKAIEKMEYKLGDNKIKVSKNKYYKIKGKQNYDDIKALLGGDGTVSEENDTGTGTTDKEYIWGNDSDENGYISVSFTNGYASFKSGNYLK
ncbi:hypothetical protein [Clostridium felsineum]|uniref:hypothetical protein n=1 Tax=Clostridium felsineum TaxID=36839 RepID=UPI00098CD691|nr:hypothetical protein [Clostridium felsineum]URZ15100.1 hypothetical protein CLFE_011170 [Clostridium felsineum DSM 794]